MGYPGYEAGPREYHVSDASREEAVDRLIEQELTPEEIVEACMGMADTIYEWLMAEHYCAVFDAVADEYGERVAELAANIQREKDAEGGYDG